VGPYDRIGERIIYFDKLDPKKPAVGYACAWELTTPNVKLCYWTKEEVLEHAARYSQAFKAKKKDSTWFTEPDKMCLKTVVANSLKRWGIMSIETRQMQMAARHDQGAQRYIDSEIVLPDEPTDLQPADDEQSSNRGNALADRMKQEREAKALPPEPEKQEGQEQPKAENKSQPIIFPEKEEAQEPAKLPVEQAADEANKEYSQRSTLSDLVLGVAEKHGKSVAGDELELAAGTRKAEKVPTEKLSAAIARLNTAINRDAGYFSKR
jgi:recombinational DNA repair protein RecT